MFLVIAQYFNSVKVIYLFSCLHFYLPALSTKVTPSAFSEQEINVSSCSILFPRKCDYLTTCLVLVLPAQDCKFLVCLGHCATL